jgi:UDP-GlcNAc:undecaprenyl-phosphate/decaprenyl-phosphate GlcNAc-1-phosphate transferase
MVHNIISILTAFLITLLSTKILLPLSRRLGFVDKPCNRKRHESHTPHIGGLCMFFGFGFACLTQIAYLTEYRALLAGSAILVFLGVIDDSKNLPAKLRLVGQLVAALLMTSWAGVHIRVFGNILGSGNIHLYHWAVPITLLAIITFINAFNMLDGLDGLAGGIALISLLSMAFLAFLVNPHLTAIKILLLLSASTLAFLCFNMRSLFLKKALVFMGDAGSTFLGFALLWFAIELSQAPHNAFNPVIVLWLLAIPLFDFVSVFSRRLLNRQSPLKADRQHLHHILLNVGFKHAHATYIMLGLSAICCGIGIGFQLLALPDYTAFYTFLLAFCVYFSLTYRAYSHDDAAK